MQFKIAKAGHVRMGYDEIGDKVYPARTNKSDRVVALDAESVSLTNGDRLSDRYLVFKNGKQTISLFKDDQWDFVIPADGKVIYNDHGE